VPGLQVVGLVMLTLQVLGLNCSHGARCGTKNVYTSTTKFGTCLKHFIKHDMGIKFVFSGFDAYVYYGRWV
jgi:hypothetical protein